MSFELALILFGLTTVVALFVEVNFTYATQGFGYGWSNNRSQEVTFSPLARRIKNAYQNQIESAGYIVPVLAGAAMMGVEHAGAQTAAMLVVLGRAAYVPLYWANVPFARLPAFAAGVLGSIYIIYVMLTV